jgi:hypothetical protein
MCVSGRPEKKIWPGKLKRDNYISNQLFTAAAFVTCECFNIYQQQHDGAKQLRVVVDIKRAFLVARCPFNSYLQHNSTLMSHLVSAAAVAFVGFEEL